jgi:hypothetical protein
MSNPLSVSGVFDDPDTAQTAVDALREADFHQEAIDVKRPEAKLFDALLPEEDRDRKTTVTVLARERRLEEKKHRGAIKRLRRPDIED